MHMAMGTRKRREKQEDIWIAHTELASAPGHPSSILMRLRKNSGKQEPPSTRRRQRRRITMHGFLVCAVAPVQGRKHLQRTDTHTARVLLRVTKALAR